MTYSIRRAPPNLEAAHKVADNNNGTFCNGLIRYDMMHLCKRTSKARILSIILKNLNPFSLLVVILVATRGNHIATYSIHLKILVDIFLCKNFLSLTNLIHRNINI